MTLLRWIAGLTSFGLALCLILAIGTQGFAIWLNTSNGSQWISKQIELALRDTPYQVKIKTFKFSGLIGLKAQEFALFQGSHEILTADNISLSINIFPLVMRHANIDISADMVSISEIPDTEPSSKTKNIFPLILSDLYFNKAHIDINIDQFSLSDAIIAGGFTTQAHLKQTFTLQKNSVKLIGLINLDNIIFQKADLVPKTTTFEGSLDFNTGQALLSKLTAEQDSYTFDAKGSYFIDQGQFESSAQWMIHNPAFLLHPTFQNPFDIKATLKNNTQEGLLGTLEAETLLNHTPASLETSLQWHDNILSLSKIKGHALETLLSGHINIHKEQKQIDGTINIDVQTFNSLKAVVGDLPFSGEGHAEIALTTENSNIPTFSIKAHVSEESSEFIPYSLLGKIRILDFKNFAVDVQTLEAKFEDGTISAQGTLTPEILDIKILAKTLDLSKIPALNLSAVPISIPKGEGHLTGSMATPILNSDITWAFFHDKASRTSPSISTQISYENEKIKLHLKGKGEGVQTLTGNLSFPTKITLKPFTLDISDKTPLQGAVEGQINLMPFAETILGQQYDIKGDLGTHAKITGTLYSPIIEGTASLKKGYFYDTKSNLNLFNIEGDIIFDQNSIHIKSLTAEDEDHGNMAAKGLIAFKETQTPDINMSLDLKSMQLFQGRYINADLDAHLNFMSADKGYLISGNITPESILISLPNRFDKAVPKLNIVEDDKANTSHDLMQKILLDVQFLSDNQIFVRGWGLDTELQGNLDITGSAAQPDIRGNLSSLRGRYEEFGKKFEIEHAHLRFQGAVPPSPYLDIEAQTQAGDIIAKMIITGQIQNPKLTLSSIPFLPQDEILSFILFDRAAQKITPFQAIQLAQALRRFSGHGTDSNLLFDPLGTIRSITGLDDLTVKGIGTDSTSIGAGKYITDKVYVEIEQGNTTNSGAANVEIEVTPSISIESKAGQNGSAGAGVFWEWEY